MDQIQSQLQLTTPGPRGCGERKQDGLYLCVGLGPGGSPVETFVLDPARPWNAGAFRAPHLFPRTNGVNDVAMWVGGGDYPFISDFIQEAKARGVSKRIPHNFDVSQLTPGRSRLVLIHPRAIPTFDFDVADPWAMRWCRHRNDVHVCTFECWSLSALDDQPPGHVVTPGHDQGHAVITTPSASYTVTRPGAPQSPQAHRYRPGAFAAFYLTHLEYVNAEHKAPAELIEKCRQANVPLAVVEK